jgi:hypothetical protein
MVKAVKEIGLDLEESKARVPRPCETKKPPACAGGSSLYSRVQLTG